MSPVWSAPFEEHGIFSLILSVISAIFVMLILSHFLYNDWIKQSKKSGIKIYEFYKLPPHSLVAGLTLLFYMLYCVQSTILSTYWTLWVKQTNHSFFVPWCLASYHQNWFFLFGKITLCLFWFVRMHQVFKTSMYFNVTKLQFITMAIIFSIPSIALSFTFGFGGLGAMNYVTDSDEDWSMIHSFEDCKTLSDNLKSPLSKKLQFATIVIYSLNEIIYSIVVIRLFVSNILKLSIYCRETHSNQSMDDGGSFFLDVSIKTANLMIVTILTNYMAFLKYSLKLQNWVFLLDVLSNVLSIYLSFSFAAKYYNLIFSPCHNKKSLYACCATLCYSCCTPNNIKDEISLTIVHRSNIIYPSGSTQQNKIKPLEMSPKMAATNSTITPEADGDADGSNENGEVTSVQSNAVVLQETESNTITVNNGIYI